MSSSERNDKTDKTDAFHSLEGGIRYRLFSQVWWLHQYLLMLIHKFKQKVTGLSFLSDNAHQQSCITTFACFSYTYRINALHPTPACFCVKTDSLDMYEPVSILRQSDTHNHGLNYFVGKWMCRNLKFLVHFLTLARVLIREKVPSQKIESLARPLCLLFSEVLCKQTGWKAVREDNYFTAKEKRKKNQNQCIAW